MRAAQLLTPFPGKPAVPANAITGTAEPSSRVIWLHRAGVAMRGVQRGGRRLRGEDAGKRQK